MFKLMKFAIKTLSFHLDHAATANTGEAWTPQVPASFPVFSSLIYPLSPHEAPHEFFTIQYSVPSLPNPTKRTAWSRVVPQPEFLFTTPPPYD